MATKASNTTPEVIAVQNRTKAVIELPIKHGKGNSAIGARILRLLPQRVHDISPDDIPPEDWAAVAGNRTLQSYINQRLIVVHTSKATVAAQQAEAAARAKGAA